MVIKMDKKSAEDHFNDGIKFKQNKKFNEAIKSFKNVLDLQLDSDIHLDDLVFHDEDIDFSEISPNPWEIV